MSIAVNQIPFQGTIKMWTELNWAVVSSVPVVYTGQLSKRVKSREND